MGSFIGRKRELSLLDDIYHRERVRTCMVYGRRRIGKTALLRKFSEGKRTLLVQFVKSSEAANVEIISNRIRDLTGSPVEGKTLHSSFSAVLDLCRQEKTIVVFDEISYLLEGNDTASSMLQYLVDQVRFETDSMFVICGSSVSFMLDEVLDKRKPLYGRFPFRIELGPLSISETRMLHPSVSEGDLLRLYLTLGGVAEYHALVGDTPYPEAMDRYILNRQMMIVDDIPYDLSVELKSMVDDAFAVLESISSGHDIYKAMIGRTGLNDYRLTKCLDRLTRIRVVKKMDSVPEARKSHRYVISDRLTSFYFNVMQKYSNVIDEGENVYEDIRPMLSTHLGKEFESYCRDLVLHSYPCEKIGSWWGSVPKRDDDGDLVHDREGRVMTEDVDIDVTATVRRGQNRMDLFGECKFRSKVMGFEALNTLQDRVRMLKGNYNVRLALFSMSGFDEDLEEYAVEGGVLLFGPGVLTGSDRVPDLS